MQQRRGFTLIELLVVMAIIATLLTIAAPRYFGHLEHAREASLRETLAVTREAIDNYHTDTGHYPETLDELVAHHYIARLPHDPITEHDDTWVLVPAPNEAGVWDLHSGASATANDATTAGDKNYADW